MEKQIVRYFDPSKYFETSQDQREVAFETFNFDIFQELDCLFENDELAELEGLNQGYQERIKKLSPTILTKELERLTIELSWKSSRIEGNTYSLLDTERLIKENKEASGHTKEEAVMILNHKKALDYIRDNRSEFSEITLRKIENVHRFVVEGLGVTTGLRKNPVGIVGTRYRPLDNEHQIREAVEKMAKAINDFDNAFTKAVVAILMISYIQPFEDGNKRTARLLGDALLFAHNACPLSLRSVDEVEYKKAMILFYEQNSARYFKDLFVDQFKFAVANYFLG